MYFLFLYNLQVLVQLNMDVKKNIREAKDVGTIWAKLRETAPYWVQGEVLVRP